MNTAPFGAVCRRRRQLRGPSWTVRAGRVRTARRGCALHLVQKAFVMEERDGQGTYDSRLEALPDPVTQLTPINAYCKPFRLQRRAAHRHRHAAAGQRAAGSSAEHIGGASEEPVRSCVLKLSQNSSSAPLGSDGWQSSAINGWTSPEQRAIAAPSSRELLPACGPWCSQVPCKPSVASVRQVFQYGTGAGR